MLRRVDDLRQTGCRCSVEIQNQACTEAENRALEGRSGVLPLSFGQGGEVNARPSRTPLQLNKHGTDHVPSWQ